MTVPTPTGVALSRASTTPVAINGSTGGTPALLPNNVFDTIEACSPDITVDLVHNKLTFAAPGWYEVCLRLASNSYIEGNNSPLALQLYRNGVLLREGPGVVCPALPNGPNSVAAAFSAALNAGDQLTFGNNVYFANLTHGLNIVGPSPYTYLTALLVAAAPAGFGPNVHHA